MFTASEIDTIKQYFQNGKSSEEVAGLMELSLTGFRSRLLNSGYRIVVTRQLEAITPVTAALQSAVAA